MRYHVLRYFPNRPERFSVGGISLRTQKLFVCAPPHLLRFRVRVHPDAPSQLRLMRFFSSSVFLLPCFLCGGVLNLLVAFVVMPCCVTQKALQRRQQRQQPKTTTNNNNKPQTISQSSYRRCHESLENKHKNNENEKKEGENLYQGTHKIYNKNG